MKLSDLWRKSLNECLIWSGLESSGSGWICVFHDVPAPDVRRLGLVVEDGKIVEAKDLNPARAFPAPAMLRSIEEGKREILASGKKLPISDALAALSPLPRWREPADFAVETPFSFASRIVYAFRRSVEQADPSLAARLPLDALYEEARSHLGRNPGVKTLMGLLCMERLAGLSFSPLHSNDGACLDWYGIWKRNTAATAPEIQERRSQAMEAAPFLAGVIPHFPALRTAVDAGKPLFEAAEQIGLSTRNISAVASLRLPMIAGEDAQPGAFIDKLALLRDLPPDWLREAKSSPDNSAALATVLALSKKAKNLKLPHDLLTAKSGGKWREHLTRITKAGADRRPPEGMDEAQYRALREQLPFGEIAAAAPIARQAVARFHVERLCKSQAPGASPDEIAAWAARIAAPDLRPSALAHLLEGMRSMAASFAATVVAPAALQAAGASGRMAVANLASLEKIASDALFGGKAGARVAELTRAFLNNEPRILGQVTGDHQAEESARSARADTLTEAEIRQFGLLGATEPSWPAIARPVMAPNGLAVVPLWSKGHLENEGRGWNGDDINEDGSRGLRICVGSHGYYLAKCLSAKAQILSIRRLGQDGAPITRLSCVELEVKSLTEVENVQHRGKHNASPSREAANALQWWLDNLGETIPFNRSWQEFARKGGALISKSTDHAQLLCGYDWRKTSNIERAWSSWRNILGRDIPDLEAILSRRDMKQMISSMSPWSAHAEDTHDVAFGRPS